jgi:hypothetical protein
MSFDLTESAAHIVWLPGQDGSPPRATRVHGRLAVVAALAGELALRRVVTVTGTGGIGKTTAALADMCRRLDGIPLAIELAAANAGLPGIRTLARRLGDGLHWRGGQGGRHRTMEAALDWSSAHAMAASALGSAPPGKLPYGMPIVVLGDIAAVRSALV